MCYFYINFIPNIGINSTGIQTTSNTSRKVVNTLIASRSEQLDRFNAAAITNKLNQGFRESGRLSVRDPHNSVNSKIFFNY